MWWDKMIFGLQAYHIVMWFLAYSILGWFVESVYMSVCNRKWTNRGFTKGPFCPIYGIGALTVFFVLESYSDRPMLLFLYGMLLATAIEFLTALLMLRLFGDFWWDYREKPFNYHGIVCMESSVAWGLYTVALFAFLHRSIVVLTGSIPISAGKRAATLILMLYAVDFVIAFYKRRKSKKQLAEVNIQVYSDSV